MKKIAITLPSFVSAESDAIVKALVSGYDRVHIRKPGASVEAVEDLLRAIPAAYYPRLSIHDHLELAKTYGLGGVHLNSRCSVIPSGFNGLVSRSCHSLDEVRQYKNEVDYLFLSPIYDSISKEGYRSNFSLDQLRMAKDDGYIDEKVYALGGVTVDRFEELQSLGFGGAAMLGSVWKQLCTPPVVLTIAGSDSSGGAGIQADIKTISALGAFAASAITAITAQNTLGVTGIEPVSVPLVQGQIRAVFDDLHPRAVKIGMLYDSQTTKAVATVLRDENPQFIVCDPVMIATSGSRLMKEETVTIVEKELFPLSTIITPNLHEASMLMRREILDVPDMRFAARELSGRYGCGVLIKGGHLSGDAMCDVLYYNGQVHDFVSPRVESTNLHGTGCTLSSAIATRLALGDDVLSAINAAKQYISGAIAAAAQMSIGRGNGPLWHFYERNRE